MNHRFARLPSLLLLVLPLCLGPGCGGSKPLSQKQDFFTSGSKEADQRASQRMAKAEQLSGSGEGSAEKGTKTSATSEGEEESSGGTNKVKGKVALFERLGGEPGISNIVADFTPRVLDDPRVNWERKGITQGGFSLHSGRSETWQATPEHVANLQQHLAQFMALATGGPAHYQGKEIKAAHTKLHIENAEFDAAVGDLKATLDRLAIPNREQKELLAIIESTRPEIVEER